VARPRTFNKDECLEQALQLFRDRGYVGASISDLVRATGVNRYSLYEMYGDKRGLFIAAFNHFHERRLEWLTELFSEPGPKIPLFRRYFESMKVSPNGKGPVSCLVTVSAVALANVDDEFSVYVLKHSLAQEKLFEATLQTARDLGEIAVDIDLRSLAIALINAGRGMRIIAPFDGFNETITAIIEANLQLLRPVVAYQNARSV
jgi:TetR/AcrR family transcriptional repressor of nem operon